MTTAGDVAASTDSLGATANHCLFVLVESNINVPHDGAAANSCIVSLENTARVELKLIRVVRDTTQMVCPKRQRAGRIGAADEVMAARLDIEAHIIHAGY